MYSIEKEYILYFNKNKNYKFDLEKSIDINVSMYQKQLKNRKSFLKRTESLLGKSKDDKTKEKLKDRYKQCLEDIKYYELMVDKDNIKSQLEYYKFFIESKMQELKKQKKEKEESKYLDKFDKCIVCFNDEIEEELNKYFQLGYTLSVKPYSIGKGKILVCLTKKYDLEIKIKEEDIVIDREDILNRFYNFRVDDTTFKITTGDNIYWG